MKDETSDKIQNETIMAENQIHIDNLKKYSLEESAGLIEQAKRSILEETDPLRKLKALHKIIEQTLSTRIAMAIEELDCLRTKHSEEIRFLQSEPGSRVREEKGTRERGQLSREFIETTKKVIREIIRELSSNHQTSTLLHDGEEPLGISYGQIAKHLIKRRYKTLYKREWTRATVQRFIDLYFGTELKQVGHEKDTLAAANITRRQLTDEYAIRMRDEVLPWIDLDQNHLTIAKQLNNRGIKTRTGGDWGNVAVKRLLERIEELKG